MMYHVCRRNLDKNNKSIMISGQNRAMTTSFGARRLILLITMLVLFVPCSCMSPFPAIKRFEMKTKEKQQRDDIITMVL